MRVEQPGHAFFIMKKITTLEVELSLMKHFNFRENVIVNGVHWGMVINGKPLHECDLLILSKANYATEVEIKISKSDLLSLK